MYLSLASKLVVPTTSTVYSQAVSMNGANATQVEFSGMNIPSGGTVTLTVQESNDLENWSSVSVAAGTNVATSGTPYNTFKCTAIASRYVRVQYAHTGNGPGIIAAGLNTASL